MHPGFLYLALLVGPDTSPSWAPDDDEAAAERPAGPARSAGSPPAAPDEPADRWRWVWTARFADLRALLAGVAIRGRAD